MNAVPSSSIPAEKTGSLRIDLQRRFFDVRRLFSGLMTALTLLATTIALIPLFSVTYLLIDKGIKRFRLDVFVSLPPAQLASDGGFANALVGTGIMVGLASLMAIPIGILAAIYLSEYIRGTRLASVIRFSAKVLSGIPSILAGVFAYALVVVTTGTNSAIAGGVALSLLILPIVVLTAEQSLRAVPDSLRQAARGAGATHSQVVTRVVWPTAFSGIVTGVLLAVARAAGETAPLLFTAMFSQFHLRSLWEPTASMSVLIYRFTSGSDDNQIELAWSAALVLVFVILALNIIGRLFSPKTGK